MRRVRKAACMASRGPQNGENYAEDIVKVRSVYAIAMRPMPDPPSVRVDVSKIRIVRVFVILLFAYTGGPTSLNIC